MIAALSRRRGMRQFVKFSIVGASGFIVNLVVFTVLQRLDPQHSLPTHFDVLYTIGFFSGGVSNYYLNRIWTFRSTGHVFRESAQFLTVSAIAWGISLGLAQLLGPFLGHGHKLWFVSTVAGIFVNFFVNKYWTFRHVS
jgi:putative flippase GtrA